MSAEPTTIELQALSESETIAIGERLGRLLSPGMLIALDGELGSGKTRFVQGLARGLNIPPDEVSSPTFVLCHVYQGEPTLLHVDAYRLKSLDEVPELGIAEALESGAVAVVEWAERIQPALPADRIQVRIEELDPARRRVTLQGLGTRSQEILSRWTA